MKAKHRMKTRQFQIGHLTVGGDAPIRVQSMCNIETTDIDGTVNQIERLTDAGCDLVRVAVPCEKAAKCIRDIQKQIRIPLVADIAFNYRLAIEAITQGVDKIRITPSNIGTPDEVWEIVTAALEHDTAVRIGVNSGALDADLTAKYGPHRISEALVESALRQLDLVTKMGLEKIVISVKASSVKETIKAYRLLAERTDFPLHVGVTEAGTRFSGTIRSAIGIGILLSEGIGNTIRVSLSADPVEEVRVGWEILKSLGLRSRGCTIVSCPTCGRTGIDIIRLAEEIENATVHIQEPLTIAVMGCIINGPGEAGRSDVAVVGGRGIATLYRSGHKVRKVEESEIVNAVLEQVEILKNGRSISDQFARAT